jgi:hypothetical protein
MNRDRPSNGQDEMGEVLSLVRLYRDALNDPQAGDRRQELRQLIQNRCGAVAADVSIPKAVPTFESKHVLQENAFERKFEKSSEFVRSAEFKRTPQIDGIEEIATSTDFDAVDQDSRIHELKIRRKLDAGGNWEHVKATAMNMFRADPTIAQAARIMELAALHGGMEEAPRLFVIFQKTVPGFFAHVHKKLREYIVANLWAQGEKAMLESVVDSAALEDATSIEILFEFDRLVASGRLVDAFMMSQQHWNQLYAGVKTFGEVVGYPQAKFWYTLVTLSVELGSDSMAKLYAAKIEKSDPLAVRASQLLGRINHDAESSTANRLNSQIASAPTAADKLTVMFDMIDLVTRNPEDRRRWEVNEVMGHPLALFPSIASVWQDFSRALINRRDSISVLPNLYKVFLQNADQFHPRVMDLALWDGPFCDANWPHRYLWLSDYLKAVACLHRFVAMGMQAEPLLWTARDLMKNREHEIHFEPLSRWNELCSAAARQITTSREINPTEKTVMLSQIKLVQDVESMKREDIVRLVEAHSNLPVSAYNSLVAISSARLDLHLELLLLNHKAISHALSNHELDRMWILARSAGKPDFGWRIATLLKFRKSLKASVSNAWEISGENRKEYPLVVPPVRVVRSIADDASGMRRRLMSDFSIAGSKLALLLSTVSNDVRRFKRSANLSPFVHELESKLSMCEWAGGKEALIHRDTIIADSELLIPPAAELIPNTKWAAVFTSISARMGTYTFQWSPKWLEQTLRHLFLPSGGFREMVDIDGVTGRCLRQMSEEERLAIQNIVHCAKVMSEEDFQELLYILVARVSSLVYSSHLDALQTLADMRMPLRVIRGLESFILSDQYGRVRSASGSAHETPIPASIQSISSAINVKISI